MEAYHGAAQPDVQFHNTTNSPPTAPVSEIRARWGRKRRLLVPPTNPWLPDAISTHRCAHHSPSVQHAAPYSFSAAAAITPRRSENAPGSDFPAVYVPQSRAMG